MFTGVVSEWEWEPTPERQDPVERPFAWAMILVDGLGEPLVSAVDSGISDLMHIGMRVQAVDDRASRFVPVEAA